MMGFMRGNFPIVVVARNNLHLTKKTIASALAQDIPVDVIVVNNASTDGTAQWLQQKPVAVIHTQEQWSLAKCWNVALRSLWKAGWDRALVVNNDVVLRRDTARLLQEHGGEFVTCVSVSREDQLGALGDRTIETLREGQRERPDFSCFLIRKSVTDKVGWFREDCWPAFLEDNFFHKKMHDGGVMALCLDLPFLHFGSSTIKNADESERFKIQRGAQKNRDKFKSIYGCLPGDCEKYDALFNNSSFGVAKHSSPPATATASAHPENRIVS